MDYSSEPDIIQIHRPVIDESDDGIFLYFHDLPPVLLKHPPIIIDDTPHDQDE